MERKPSEILDSEIRKRNIGPGDREYAVWDTTGGLTDELREANILNTLGNTYLMRGAESVEDPNIPTLDVVLSRLGVKADDDPTGIKAARKFVDEFSTKHDAWKKKITNDPAWGERGWETVYDLFKKTSNDLMNYDIKEGRKKIASGEVDKGFDWLQAKAANLVFPRAVKAVEEGRDPTGGEWARDAFSNAAYAVPFGRVAKVATKGAPVVLRAVSAPASQFVAPTVVAGVDEAANPETDFTTDVLAGGLTNLGVNRVLGPMIGRGIATGRGAISTRLPSSVRNVLEGKPRAIDRADDLVRTSRETLKKEERGLSKGLSSPEDIPSREEVRNATKILEISKAVDEPFRTPDGRIVIDRATNKPISVKDIIGITEKQRGDELMAREAPNVVGSAIQQVLHPNTVLPNGTMSKAFREGAKSYTDILRSNNDLMALFKNSPKFLSKEITPDVMDIGTAYAVNQFGNKSDKPANLAGAAVGVDVDKLRKDSEKSKAKTQARIAVSDILSASPDVTEEDAKYLEMVRKNPDVLKFSQDDGFKQWLLRRGHSILSGTPAHRPIWEVK